MVRRLLCFLGIHGPQAGSGVGIGSLRWCLRCGRTYAATYDGIEASWQRVRHLRFGEPR